MDINGNQKEMKMSKKNSLILNCTLTCLAIGLNAFAIQTGTWNWIVGQSLIVCPVCLYLSYKRIIK